MTEPEFIDRQIRLLEESIKNLKLAKVSVGISRHNHLSRARKPATDVTCNVALLMENLRREHLTDEFEGFLDDKNRFIYKKRELIS